MGERREESGIPPWEHFEIVRNRPRRSLSISVVSWVTTSGGAKEVMTVITRSNSLRVLKAAGNEVLKSGEL